MRWASQFALLVFSGGLLVLGPAQAQDADRYRRIPTEDGFLEVETATGAVRECRRTAEGYRCSAPSADKPQGELERLTRENLELRQRLGPNPGSPKPPPDEEIDRALSVMERFLRRFMNILREERPDRT